MSERWHLVSGVTSGMGRAFLDLLRSKAGERIVAIVRDRKQVMDVQADRHIVLDFARPDTVDVAFDGFDQPLHSFINYAAILPGRTLLGSDHVHLQNLFNINVLTPMLVVRTIEPLLQRGSTVLLLGSIAGFKGSYDDPYAATKGAIHSLVKSLALKFAPDRRVVGLAPGMTQNTRMTDNLIPGRFDQNLETIPLRQAGDPRDLAQLAYFLLSDACRFMTGNVIDVNGGQYMR